MWIGKKRAVELARKQAEDHFTGPKSFFDLSVSTVRACPIRERSIGILHQPRMTVKVTSWGLLLMKVDFYMAVMKKLVGRVLLR